jgi:hypothetical protein
VEDLEALATGSSDEIVLARDLRLLTNEDYPALVEALPP